MGNKQTVIQAMVQAQEALNNSTKTGGLEWAERWKERLDQLLDLLPSGSGIDNGTIVIALTANALILSCEFHHMNDAGTYDGWTKHRLTFRPRLDGYLDVRVTGRNRGDIKDYLADTYLHALQADAPPPKWLFDESVDLESVDALLDATEEAVG